MLALLIVCVCLIGSSLAERDNIAQMRKLKDALDRACSGGGGGPSAAAGRSVTWSMVSKTAGEYDKLDSFSRKTLEDNKASQMMIDFAIVPTIQSRDMLGDSESRQFFVERLIKEYCFFRPAYLQASFIGDPVTIPKSPKFNRILKVTQGQMAGRLTLEDFKAAQRELAGWDLEMARIRREGDIYAELDTFRELLNLNNYEAVNLLRQQVFPMLQSGFAADTLSELYAMHLREAGYKVESSAAGATTAKPLSQEELEKTLSAGGTRL